jgi:hypothetical protein
MSQRGRRYGIVLLLLSFVLALANVLPASAQSSGVTMAVTPYLGGHVKYGEWLPLRVSLSNAGGDLAAEVQTEIASSSGTAVYAAPAPLPAGARKEIVLYTLPSNFTQEIVVRLVVGDQVLAEAKARVSAHPQNEYLVGAVVPDDASDEGALAMLNGLTLPERAQTRFVLLSLADLPERVEALRSLDCLILAGVDTTELTPAQGEALRGWVELGGQLLIGGGAGAQRVLAGLPESLRPLSLGETVELTALDGLADFAGEPIRVPGTFLAALPADYRGRAVVRQNESALLVQQALGGGWVDYLALDPTASPFDAWAGALPFWQKVLEAGSALPPNAPIDIPRRNLESEQMGYALSNLPPLDLPSIRWLAILLGLYVVLVGPVNYLFLRRLRRLDWAWITIPALTLAFSLGGYGLGYSLRGGDVIVHQISVIPLSPGSGHLAVRSYIGLFSPSRTDYSVQVGGDALISPLTSYYQAQAWGPQPSTGSAGPGIINVLQGDPALVRNLGVSQWAMQSFQAEVWLPADGLALDAALTIEGDRVRGTIRNGLGHPVQAMILVNGQRFVYLDGLAVGEEREISATLQSSSTGSYFPWALFEQFYQGPNPPARELTLRQSILEAYFHTNWGTAAPPAEPTLFAWADYSPLDVQVAGVQASSMQTALFVVPLPLPIVDGRVSLPPGTISGRVAEIEGSAGDCGPDNRVYVAVGRAVLKYQLPASLRGLRLTALSIYPGTDGGPVSTLPTLALYDWDAGEWVNLEGVEMGREYAVADPGRFLSPASGAIRLQVQQNDMMGMCYKFDVSLEGELPPEGGAR